MEIHHQTISVQHLFFSIDNSIHHKSLISSSESKNRFILASVPLLVSSIAIINIIKPISNSVFNSYRSFISRIDGNPSNRRNSASIASRIHLSVSSQNPNISTLNQFSWIDTQFLKFTASFLKSKNTHLLISSILPWKQQIHRLPSPASISLLHTNTTASIPLQQH